MTGVGSGNACASEDVKGLPENFAPDFCVRNTFIDCAVPRRPSLDDFMPRNRCFSAPTHTVDHPRRRTSTIEPVLEENEAEDMPGPYVGGIVVGGVPTHVFMHSANQCLGSFAGAYTAFVPMPWQAPTVGLSATSGNIGNMVKAAPNHGSSGHGVGVRSYANAARAAVAPMVGTDSARSHLPSPLVSPSPYYVDAIQEQETMDQPTAHAAGLCKPCAWFHSAKGCKTGPMCQFCHACGPGELKRRKREKAILLAMQSAQ